METSAGSDELISFVLDGARYYARWRAHEDALDHVVVSEAGQWAFPRRGGCLEAWPPWQPEPDESPPADFDAVVGWLAGRSLAMPAENVLNAWNLAGDIARGVGAPWHDRGRLRDRVFDKLTYASVPWLIGRETYVPRWSSRELDAARRMGSEAVALVRTSVR